MSYVKEGVENQSTINNASSESEQELSTIYDSMVTWSKSSKLKGAGTSRYNYFYRGSYQAMDPLAHFDQQLGLIISTLVSSHLLRAHDENKALPPLECRGECDACNCDDDINDNDISLVTYHQTHNHTHFGTPVGAPLQARKSKQRSNNKNNKQQPSPNRSSPTPMQYKV